MTGVRDQQRLALGGKLYERYAQPLEAEHWGEFIAIAEDGRILLGPSLWEVTEEALNTLGPGGFIFKIGEKVVGKWR